jgi:hypothetical protein
VDIKDPMWERACSRRQPHKHRRNFRTSYKLALTLVATSPGTQPFHTCG